MKNLIFITVLFSTLSFTGISQDGKGNTIDEQIKNLIDNSNSYQDYKVIKTSEIGKLRTNIKDSIAALKTTIVGSQTIISDQKNKIETSTNQIEVLQNDLEQTQKKVDSIEFLGYPSQKASYKTIMWSIVFVLLLLSLILFFVFKRGQRKAKDAREKLALTEIELESLRKRSLEREQIVRRELQDEINRNRLKKE